ncbi:MAG: extracellular solute-binding protein [Bacteroidales bacterium]|nr:extracellular solute-binding protein [Clostridium sp.]MCM1204471.1 extracellular solute-binding protein [Bacteroidales bacterium]
MQKKRLKKAMAAVMAVVMLFSMTGCGGGEGGSNGSKKSSEKKADTKNMTYAGSELAVDGIEGDPNTFVVKDDKLYLLTYEWKEIKGGDKTDTEEETSEEAGTEEETSEEETSEEAGTEEETSEEETSEEAGTEEETSEEETSEEAGTEEETSEEEMEYESITRLYVAELDGSGAKELPMPELTENEYVSYMSVNGAKEINLFINSWNEKTEKNSYVVLKLDENGKEVSREDITKVLDAGEESYVSKLLFNDKGNIIAVMEQSIFILDENYKKVCELKSDRWIGGAAITKDGQVICGIEGEDTASVQVVDIENQKWGETVKLDLRYFMSSDSLMNGSGAYDFYYKDDSGIYGYNLAEKKDVKVMDYLASNISSNNAYNIIPAGEDRFIGTEYAEGAEKAQIIQYTKVDPSTIKDKKVITLGCLYGVDDGIRKKAIEFNKENDEYRVEFKDYSNEEDSQTKMNADIAAGNVPDIIMLDSLPLEQYTAKGILEDLTPYFDKDEELNTSDIRDSVLAAMQSDGKLYYIAPSFGISTLMASTEVVGTESGWTFEEMKEVLDKQKDDVRPFYSENKSEMLYSFLGTGLTDFIDWETGECSFDSDDFKSILEICNTGKNEETEYNEDSPSMPTLIQSGKVLFTDGWINLEEIQMYEAMYGGKLTFIGYPNKDKQGSYFQFSQPMGIYSKSEVKDGAWEFIRVFMTKEYQGNNDYMYNTPVRKDCYDLMVKARMATEPYTDEFGNEVSPVNSTYGWDDFEVKIKPSTQEEVDKYTALIDNTKKAGSYNDSLMEIVQEEAKAYFAGEKSLDETVGIIQNRIKTYVNENR